MSNLAIAVGAVFVAYVANIFGEPLVALIIIPVSFYVFGLLLYQAQLLPELAMTYLDNKLIHDGKTPKKHKPDMNKMDIGVSISNEMEKPFINNETVIEDEGVIHPLISLLIRASQNSGVDCLGIESLDTWILTVTEDQAKDQICKAIAKIEEAKGIVPTVKLEPHGDSLEVRV